MKILTTQQIREADAATIENEPISSIDLMERAARAFTQQFLDTFGFTENDVLIFCGPGNNGGDGLAVACMLLAEQINAKAYAIKASEKVSDDFNTNRTRLSKHSSIEYIEKAVDIPDIPRESIVIDAMFGSGLNRKVEGVFVDVIQVINQSGAAVVSIDIPSGLYADRPLEDENPSIVKADFTFTFQIPKLSFFLPYSEVYVGRWEVLDIGLDKAYIDNAEAQYYYTDYYLAVSLLKKRRLFAHKGDFGKTIIISGSYGKIGAAVLCARACLRAGVGLLTVHVPQCGYQIMQIANPEAMTTVDRHEYIFTALPQEGPTSLDKYNVVGVGPGIGTAEETVQAMKQLLSEAQQREMPIVLDADALNIIAKNQQMLNLLPQQAILTPHPKEFERLTEPARNDYHRLELLVRFTQQYQVYVVLKGAHTAIGTPDGKICFNSTGNPGMASGGTGDALTGIITSLLSQRYDALDASLLGVYLHGLAGDIASESTSQEAMLASDLIEHLGAAFLHISEREET